MKALYFENKLSKIVALKAASVLDKYAALGRLSPLKYGNIPEPNIPNSRWLKVKNHACGLCGTDLHFMFMDMDPKAFPAAIPGVEKKFLGHELVGEVVEVGSQVDSAAVGDRVAMRIDWPSCNQMEINPPCSQCATGNYMLCENSGLGSLPTVNVGGGFSPYMIMHNSQPFVIPKSMDADAAVLIEPVASAVHGVLKAPPMAGESILVIGAGTIGLLSVAMIRYLQPEANVSCLVRHDFQAKVVEQMGAKVIRDGSGAWDSVGKVSGGRAISGYFGNKIMLGGFDRIYDSVGNDATLNNALRWTKGGGTVVLVGINFTPGHIDYSPIWCQEINLVGINCHATEADGRTSFEIAAAALMDNAVPVGSIITHRYPVSDYKDAVKAFLNKGQSKAIKIVLEH